MTQYSAGVQAQAAFQKSERSSLTRTMAISRREGESANIAMSSPSGVVAETTAALLKDREAQKGALRKQLQNVANQRLNGPIHIDAGVIKAQLAKLDDVLRPGRRRRQCLLPRASEDPVHPQRTRWETVLSGLRRGERR